MAQSIVQLLEKARQVFPDYFEAELCGSPKIRSRYSLLPWGDLQPNELRGYTAIKERHLEHSMEGLYLWKAVDLDYLNRFRYALAEEVIGALEMADSMDSPSYTNIGSNDFPISKALDVVRLNRKALEISLLIDIQSPRYDGKLSGLRFVEVIYQKIEAGFVALPIYKTAYWRQVLNAAIDVYEQASLEEEKVASEYRATVELAFGARREVDEIFSRIPNLR